MSSIEQGENLLQMEGWHGDWKAGERPEGYKETTRKYKMLQQEGFSVTKELGGDFSAEYNELLAKAKEGMLLPEEVEKLIECNKALHGAMDKYFSERL